MASTKATELAQLSRKLTYNEGTDIAAIDGDGDILTTGDNTDQLQEGLTNLYYTDARARGILMATIAQKLALLGGNVDASGEVDSNTIDGLDSLQFLRSDVEDSINLNVATGQDM